MHKNPTASPVVKYSDMCYLTPSITMYYSMSEGTVLLIAVGTVRSVVEESG